MACFGRPAGKKHVMGRVWVGVPTTSRPPYHNNYLSKMTTCSLEMGRGRPGIHRVRGRPGGEGTPRAALRRMATPKKPAG